MTKYKAIKVNGVKYDEHRYIMEQYLGRKLRKDEVVHHKDGNKRNNDIENLVLMSRSEHSREHQLGRKMSEESKKKMSETRSGIKSPLRKLNDYQIEQIWLLHNDGYSNRKIAKLLNSNRQTINDIINGKRYKN